MSASCPATILNSPVKAPLTPRRDSHPVSRDWKIVWRTASVAFERFLSAISRRYNFSRWRDRPRGTRKMTNSEDDNSARSYVLGHTGRELDRLSTQARLLEPITRRWLHDAGIAPGMQVLDVGTGVGDVA